MEIAHVRVAGGEQHTKVGRESRDDQRAGVEILEKRFECGREESRMLRLQDEVVRLLRNQNVRDRTARSSILHDVIQQSAKIRPPFPEVVIDVNDGNSSFACPSRE